MGVAAIGLTAGRSAEATIGSLLVMGVAGGLLLVTIQALLADHHGERRAIALTEANVAASVAYVVLIGALSLTSAIGVGWRAALLASLIVSALAWWSGRGAAIETPPVASGGGHVAPGDLLGRRRDALLHHRRGVVHRRLGRELRRGRRGRLGQRVGHADGRLLRRRGRGRIAGSALARRHSPHRLLAIALVVTAAGFAILWPAASPVQALLGPHAARRRASATCSRSASRSPSRWRRTARSWRAAARCS